MCRNKQNKPLLCILLCFIVLLSLTLSGCTKHAGKYIVYNNTFEEINQASFIIAQNALKTEPYLNEIHGNATDEITDLLFVYKDGKTHEIGCFVTLHPEKNTLEYFLDRECRGFGGKIHQHADSWTVTFNEMLTSVKDLSIDHNIKYDRIDFWTSPVYENVLVLDLVGNDNSRYRVNANMENGAIYEGLTEDIGLWGYIKQ